MQMIGDVAMLAQAGECWDSKARDPGFKSRSNQGIFLAFGIRAKESS